MAMATTATTASITSVTLEVADPEAAHRFHTALGVDTHIRLRPSEAHSTGFRGFTLALTVSQPPPSTASSAPPWTPAPRC